MAQRLRAGLRRKSGSVIAACSLIAAAGVVVGTPALSCDAPLRSMQRIELMFGRNTGHLRVGDTAWARFLAREITPRFPDGLTVLDAAGQWRDPADGRVVREPSKLVVIVTPDNAPADDRIAAIVAAYKHRFRQKSVGIVTSPACAAF